MASCLDEFHGSGGQGSEAGQPHFNAFFYSLVSTDTREMYFSKKREDFLVNQGYAFRVITNLLGIANAGAAHSERDNYHGVGMGKRDQLNILAKVLDASESEGAIESVRGDETGFAAYADAAGAGAGAGARLEATRVVSSMRALSGAVGMAYAEFDRDDGAAGAGGQAAAQAKRKRQQQAAAARAGRPRHKIFEQRKSMPKQVYK